MAVNTQPVFPKTPKVNVGVTLTTANTAKDGTGTTSTIYTAGADGGVLKKIRACPLGTNVATVLRVFLNNGSSSATATNNQLIFEKTLPATTLSEVAAQTAQEIDCDNLPIPATYKINICIGTAVSAGVAVTAIASDYS